MGRRQNDSDFGRFALFALFLIGTISCSAVYLFLSVILRPNSESLPSAEDEGPKEEQCCRGVENLELWGEAVKWGSEFVLNSSEECCMACKRMCNGEGGPCLCNSWVYCGDREACGPRFGECWLKKQQDALNPDRRDSGDLVMWTSGLVFRKGEEIVGMETDHGILRIKLLPECAPNSVFYILELLALPHCIGCQIHRAESRGSFWDSKGNHIKRTPYGPPFALIQGTLESHGSIFKDIPKEYCPTVRRGSVAWVGSGPEFFISLADHEEWRNPYTVFGYVLSEDMEVLEKISQLPTKSEIWNSIKISILENPVSLRFRRMNTKS
ncbi:hypothetical protein LR48_Vigan03g034200 [Vigna angularis]|uniref:PPIase cyclophilin-type domain-containing protein n=2 Tax=Phaseolus angularis TaxID=3914 RepID=A0A0L9U2H4_PHAAN|nr:uncharacterized protein LOC108329539 [Vigna angularis]KAG2404173.1 uncharacterized protein HKW66_Vig0110950 [Vigna angularis]KOM36961.1 hypothetical protein LR48_Vigan03g034200 [Vigna angularis]BAT83468.1 hypothetical protein VIGAN_04061600 [Vigna angularis var. angularis]